MSVALLTIQGRLAKDIEFKTTPSGTKYGKVSVPVDQGYRDAKTTGWYNVTIWGNRADQVEKATAKGMFLKGQQVFVSGTLEQRPYGDGKVSMDINANVFEPVLMPRDTTQSSEDRPSYGGGTSPQSWPEKMEQEGFDDMGSVPF